jgi:alanine or glycine:cation symporter, AGCS family
MIKETMDMTVLDHLTVLIEKLTTFVWGWPLILFIIGTGITMTISLSFIQFRYFGRAWKYVLFPEEKGSKDDEHISPLQAFVNTLSASIGNGSTAGMATAMYSGGPGAAFWIFVLGFFNMAIRFAEVYASTHFVKKTAQGIRGGPMIYLQLVPAGKYLAYGYAFFCLMLTLITGNAMQCNSMRIGIEKMTCLNPVSIAVIMFIFLLYVMLGGAQRIIRVSDKIVPVKVGLFFIATLYLILYHWANIIDALRIIIMSAFNPQAIAGGMLGFTVQGAISYGMSRMLNATEAGLGTAAILYGTTGSKHPVRSGIMSMASAFISSQLVCFMLMLVFVVSGVWDSGLTSTALTIAAYETAFGSFGGWVVTFLSITFGMGVLVAYAYIGRECWFFLTGGKAEWMYTSLYCLMAFFGALSKVALIWSMTDIINAGLLLINLYGLLVLLPEIKRGVQAYINADE